MIIFNDKKEKSTEAIIIDSYIIKNYNLITYLLLYLILTLNKYIY